MMGGMRRSKGQKRRPARGKGGAGGGAGSTAAERGAKKLKMPDYKEFITKLDFTGAQAVLEFQKRSDEETPPVCHAMHLQRCAC